MMHRHWTVRIGLLLVALLGTACVEPAPRRVILITVDTLRADRLGCYGDEAARSPAIDRLAAGATLFEQATCQAPFTTGSVASLMTGAFASEALGSRHQLNPELPTLAERLQNRGWTTAAVLANPRLSARRGFSRGFQYYRELFRTSRLAGDDPNRGARKVTADEVTDAVEELLPELPEEDLFLWVLYLDPHAPFIRHPDRFYSDPPEELAEADPGQVIPLRKPEPSDRPAITGQPNALLHPYRSASKSGPDATAIHNLLGATREQELLISRLYDGEVGFVDHHLGELLLSLERAGLLEGALVILTADHGESLFDHEDYFGHGLLPYQACGRVPLIIRWPSAEPGRITEPVALVDLVPTILEYARLPRNGLLRGRPLTPSGRQGGAPILLESIDWKHRALRLGSLKLVDWSGPGRPDRSLFHLGADPSELEDRAPGESETVHRMGGALDDLVRELTPAPDHLPDPEVDPEVAAGIRALGYVE